MSVNVHTYLNCTEAEICQKKFNIWLGISLGNKYFNKKNILEYLRWAIAHTRDNVLVVIADSNHAVNYEVFNHFSKEKALRHALDDGHKIRALVQDTLKDFPDEERNRIKIVTWDDVRALYFYQEKKAIVLDEFENNSDFHDYVINIVKENLKERAVGLSVEKLNTLSEYILDELPILLFGPIHQGKRYDLHPYPGINSFDKLLMGLQTGELFRPLADKLHIEERMAEVEAYIE